MMKRVIDGSRPGLVNLKREERFHPTHNFARGINNKSYSLPQNCSPAHKKFNNKNCDWFIALTIFFFLLIFLPSASADIVSQNSGGSTNLSVGTDKYIEGFFFVGMCGDNVLDSSLGETCDDGNTVAGDGCSAVCLVEIVGGGGGGSGGGTGGGGGGAGAAINVTPIEFNINMVANTTTERTIRVTNTGSSMVTLAVGQSNLGNHVILGQNNLTIGAGQSVDLEVIFIALSEPGIYTGIITIGGQAVLVSLNVQTKLLLFDSNIVVLNPNYQVAQGGELETRVTLIPLGDDERLDVGLFFTIRDYAGNIYLTKSETMLVDRLSSLDRDFDTGALTPGKYIIGLELRYPNGVAPSSAYFEVLPRTSIWGKLIIFLISLILLLLIAILLVIIWKRRKKKEDEQAETDSPEA